MAAASRRYDAGVVITTQLSLNRGDLLPIPEFEVLEPDAGIKLAIAERAAGGPLHDATLPLLDCVRSGFEARIIGEVGQAVAVEASRYAVFDAYARKRLGTDATDGIEVLARVAGYLCERVSFGLTVRELDRLAERGRIASRLLQRLGNTNLLTTRGDRVSFAHELLLDAFTAGSIVRRPDDRAVTLLAALHAPQHRERQALIVGAIDDVTVLMQVLADIDDAALVEACLAGLCGAQARIWASRTSEKVIRRMRAEIEHIAFEISDEALFNVRAVQSSLLQWTPKETAFLRAFAVRLADGHHFDEIFDAIAAMDRRLVHEHERLRSRRADER